MQILIVLALVFASFVALFALQNAQTVPIRIFAWERETSVAVIVLATAALGALSAVLAGLVRQVKGGIRFRQMRAELSKVTRSLEEEREKRIKLQSEFDALVAKQSAGSPASEVPEGDSGSNTPIDGGAEAAPGDASQPKCDPGAEQSADSSEPSSERDSETK